MSKTKTAPMENNSIHVQTTNDYSLFKTLNGNRKLNELHVKRLSISFQERYLFSPIIINENHQIIDGQHRFEAAKKLGLPINFFVIKGYGLPEIQILNANSKNWNADDFLQGYCDLGIREYLKYKEFKETYGYGHNECMAMLSGSVGGTGNVIKTFYSGKFKIKDLQKANDTAQKISQVGEFYQGYKRRSFVLTMMGLLGNINFSLPEFLSKLMLQPSALTDCKDIPQYRLLIENIYNFKRREKVNLRF
jgi:hypothetical protein